MPNLGINLPTASLGAGWRIGNERQNAGMPVARPTYDQKWQTSVHGAFGAKELYPAGGRKYPAASARLEQRYLLNYGTHIAGSADVFYNSSLKHRIASEAENSGNPASVSNLDNLQTGLFITVDQHFHRFTIGAGMGRYLVNKDTEEGPFYHRVHARFDVTNRFSAQLALKAHWFAADYIEAGLVYHLKKAPWQAGQ